MGIRHAGLRRKQTKLPVNKQHYSLSRQVQRSVFWPDWGDDHWFHLCTLQNSVNFTDVSNLSREKNATQAHLLLSAESSIFCEVSDFNSMESYGNVVEEMTTLISPGKMEILGPALWDTSGTLGTGAKNERRCILGRIRHYLNCHLIHKEGKYPKVVFSLKLGNMRPKSQLNGMAKGADRMVKEFTWAFEFCIISDQLLCLIQWSSWCT